MEIRRLMKHDVRTCRPGDSLNEAARIMWEEACGSVPVVDEDFIPVGFLTDRDICMASYTQGKPLLDLKVETAMAKNPISCSSEDDLDGAAELMREKCLRRLLVVNSHGVFVGLLSLDDVACESQRILRGAKDHILTAQVGDIYGSICAMRCRRRHSPDPPLMSSSY
jgi:CBS domain-containing protein